MMAKQATSWRTLVLGAVLGYLMAVMTMTPSDGNRNVSYDIRRFLSHGEEDAVEEGEEASGEGEEHGVNAVSFCIPLHSLSTQRRYEQTHHSDFPVLGDNGYYSGRHCCALDCLDYIF
jgi:hypothetical protein